MDGAWHRAIERRAARIENRLETDNTRAAFRFWLDIVQNGRYPSRGDVTPHSLRQILPHVILLDVLREPLDFRYRLVGTKADYFIGERRTDMLFSQLTHQARGSNIFAIHEQVVQTGFPEAGRIPYIGPFSDFRELRDIILPLFDADGEVTHILGVIDFPVKKTQCLRPRRSTGAVGRGLSLITLIGKVQATAVRRPHLGQFLEYPVATIDQELFGGVEAGRL